MKDAFLSLLETFGLAYWVKVSTASPNCVYYFGPFSSREEAGASAAGYCEDLQSENAEGITASVERCKPQHLTITEDWGEMSAFPKKLATAA